MSKVVLTFLIASVVLCVGCQSGTQLMPTPNLYATGGVDPFPDVPPALQSNRVEVLYLTDRKPEKPEAGNPHYGYQRSRSVAFGVSEVEIGKNVSWDQLVAASRASKRSVDLPLRVVKTDERVRFPETPRILMDLPSNLNPAEPPRPGATTLRAEVDEDLHRCHQEISARLAKTPDKEVYIFVHGYDNTFDDSVVTIAQMWHFLGRRGVPIAYSWPAGGKGLLRGYEYDFQSSEFTVYHLKEMIRGIAKCDDVQKINIICHSRGTGVVVTALADLHLEISGSGRSTREVLKLKTLVLAAPDIDFDVLIQQAVTVRLGQVPEHTAMYVCAKDEALGISGWLAGGMIRAGAMRSDMFTPEELEMLRATKTVQIIDCRISDPGPYGHSYFHANPAVSSDLILLMRYGASPDAEHGRPLGHDKSGFWYIEDGYPAAKTTISQ
jgi:esterase/lipase superfamily enzyme